MVGSNCFFVLICKRQATIYQWNSFVSIDKKEDDNSSSTERDRELDKQVSVEEFKLCFSEDLKENE